MVVSINMVLQQDVLVHLSLTYNKFHLMLKIFVCYLQLTQNITKLKLMITIL